MSCIPLLILLSFFFQTLCCLSIDLRLLIYFKPLWYLLTFLFPKITFNILLMRNLNYSIVSMVPTIRRVATTWGVSVKIIPGMFRSNWFIWCTLDSIRPWSIGGYWQSVLIRLHIEVSERILTTNNGLWVKTIVHVTLCANWIKRSS